MPPIAPQSRRRVAIGSVLALAVTAAWLFWTKSNQPPASPVPRGPEAFVKLAGQQVAGGDPLLREKAELFDPAPLFIPTERNYGQDGLPASVVRQPGQVFADFAPKLQTAESGLPTYGSETAAAPDNLPEILSRANEVPFAGFGQWDVKRTPLAERAGYIEAKLLLNGNLMIDEPLALPPLPRADFGPAEFVVVVWAGGVVGEPVIKSGSGWDEVDAVLREHLAKRFNLGSRLPPGQYLVSIGP